MDAMRVAGPGEKKLQNLVNGLDSTNVGKVGWFKLSQYEDGTPVAYVATIQEYGYPEGNIPARPMLRPTIISKKKKWAKMAEQGAKDILNGGSTIDSVLEKIGQSAAGDARKTITAITEPPLSPLTIQARLAKRSNKTKVGNLTKPLVDTGLLLNSLTNVVEPE